MQDETVVVLKLNHENSGHYFVRKVFIFASENLLTSYIVKLVFFSIKIFPTGFPQVPQPRQHDHQGHRHVDVSVRIRHQPFHGAWK